MLQLKLIHFKWTATAWLIFISILFVLPGSALPREHWFDKIYVDKWVHVLFFAILLFLWRSAIQQGSRIHSYILLLLAFLYGLTVEFVQENWVPNRSFDWFDVLADIIGSVAGLLLWGMGKKNKPL